MSRSRTLAHLTGGQAASTLGRRYRSGTGEEQLATKRAPDALASIVRWTVTAVADAATRFRKLAGPCDGAIGLGGSVWTSDPERGKAVARRVRTGTIGINRYMPDPGAPFGGVKASGIGRELGPDAIGAYQQFKSLYA